jgi:hypothetical protein
MPIHVLNAFAAVQPGCGISRWQHSKLRHMPVQWKVASSAFGTCRRRPSVGFQTAIGGRAEARSVVQDRQRLNLNDRRDRALLNSEILEMGAFRCFTVEWIAPNSMPPKTTLPLWRITTRRRSSGLRKEVNCRHRHGLAITNL